MNTPFKMKPGRGNNPKTGYGIPTPLKQQNVNPKTKERYANVSSKSATEMDQVIQENKRRLLVESQAKADSTAAAGARKMSGGNKFQQGMAGNKAANKTRIKGGAGDMMVYRGKSVGSGQVTSEGDTVYFRNKPVERNHPYLTRNPKTGEY